MFPVKPKRPRMRSSRLWGAFRPENRLALMGSPRSFISLSGMIWGMFFSNGLVSVESDNWKSKLDKPETVLNLWKQREFVVHRSCDDSYCSRCQSLLHVAKIVPPPSWMCESFLTGPDPNLSVV